VGFRWCPFVVAIRCGSGSREVSQFQCSLRRAGVQGCPSGGRCFRRQTGRRVRMIRWDAREQGGESLSVRGGSAVGAEQEVRSPRRSD